MTGPSGRPSRWLFGSWRRLVICLVILAALAAVVLLNRSSVEAFASQLAYWLRLGRSQQGDAFSRASFKSHPLALQLPARDRLLDAGDWATPEAGEALLTLRRQHPGEAREIDYYRACWDAWNGRWDQAEETFRQQDRTAELLQLAARRGQIDKVRQYAEDPRNPHAVRTLAWYELGQQADRFGRRTEAARHYLRALETCPSDPSTTLIRLRAWQAVRERVGTDISLEQYAASLRVLASHTQEQPLLKEILFELGKIDLLTQNVTAKEVTP